MNKKIGLGVFLGIIVLIGLFFFTSYNNMVSLNEKVDAKYSDIDTQLQRRADLVPNLVSSVKGIMSHEQAAIDKIPFRRNEVHGLTLDLRLSRILAVLLCMKPDVSAVRKFLLFLCQIVLIRCDLQ